MPSGGWSYKDPDSGVPFKENHIDALLGLVRRHRIANNLTVGGEWTAAFYSELCSQNPAAPCHDAEAQVHYVNGDDLSSFLATIVTQRESGIQQVSQEEYDRRVGICMRCPSMGSVSCSGSGAFARMLERAVAGIRVSNDVAPGRSCLACGCNISSKCAYPVETLKKVDAELGRTPAYATECWMLE